MSPAIMWNQGTLRIVGRVRVPRVDVVLAQPAVDVVLVVLLAPQQARERLAHHERAVGVERGRDHLGVERVGLLEARGEDRVEVDRSRRAAVSRTGSTPTRRLRSRARGGRRTSCPTARPTGAPAIRWSLIADFEPVSFSQNQQLAVGLRSATRRAPGGGATRAGDRGLDDVVAPRPGVAEPQRRQQVQRRGVGAAVVRGDAHQDVVVRGLRVLDDHVEVAVVVEDPGVEQLVLVVLLAAAAVLVRRGPRTGTPRCGYLYWHFR